MTSLKMVRLNSTSVTENSSLDRLIGHAGVVLGNNERLVVLDRLRSGASTTVYIAADKYDSFTELARSLKVNFFTESLAA